MAKKKLPQGKKPQDTEDEKETQEGQEGTEGEDQEEDDGDDAAEDNRRINAIVTSRVKREMKAVNSTLQAMQKTLEALSQPKKPDEESESDDDDEGEEKGKKSAEDPKLARKLERIQKELADERAARKKAEQEKAEEAERSKKSEMRNAFDAALTELGCSDPMLRRSALRVLEEDGIMIRDEDGKIRFKGTDKYGGEVNYDPKTGLKNWIAGDGKSFVPAIDASGSGTGGARINNGSGNFTRNDIKKMSKQQLAEIEFERACMGLPPLDVGDKQ